MSTMEPMYGIPSALRYAIKAYTDWDEPDIVARIIEEVRELLNEHASKLTEEQIKENMNYVFTLEAYLNNLVSAYSQIGIFLSKEKIKDYAELGLNLGSCDSEEADKKEEQEKTEDNKREIEYTPEQKFSRHVLADCKHGMAEQVELSLIALKVLEIAKEELGKHLPGYDATKTENMVLQKVNPDVNNLC